MKYPAGLIVMGSSWGGLVALREVLGALPADFLVPVVVVQHRGARANNAGGGVGSLVDVLAGQCALPVAEPDDRQPIEAGRVYLAPADYHLIVEGRTFALSTDEKVQHSRPSVDVLFESAADACGAAVVAVVLTGANRDGADGVVAVARRGGHVIAQDPTTAAMRSMPEAAVATGCVDEVMALEAIGPRLRELCASSDPVGPR